MLPCALPSKTKQNVFPHLERRADIRTTPTTNKRCRLHTRIHCLRSNCHLRPTKRQKETACLCNGKQHQSSWSQRRYSPRHTAVQKLIACGQDKTVHPLHVEQFTPQTAKVRPRVSGTAPNPARHGHSQRICLCIKDHTCGKARQIDLGWLCIRSQALIRDWRFVGMCNSSGDTDTVRAGSIVLTAGASGKSHW